MDVARTFIAAVSDDALRDAADVHGALEDEALDRHGRRDFNDTQARYRAYGRDALSGARSAIVRRPSRRRADARTVPSYPLFEATYRSRYGHLNEGASVEFIALRVGARLPHLTGPGISAAVAGLSLTAVAVPRAASVCLFRRRPGGAWKQASIAATLYLAGFRMRGPRHC